MMSIITLKVWLLATCGVMMAKADLDARTTQPNIVFVLADDQGWSDIGYQNPEVITPHLDAMAREGVILDHNYVTAVCTPTRATILTGKYTFNTGEQHFVLRIYEPRCLDENLELLPQALNDLGYVSHAMGKWHLGFCKESCLPTHRGFETFTGLYHGEGDHVTHESEGQILPGVKGIDWHIADQNGQVNSNASWGIHATDLVSDKAAETILAHDQSKPLFLYLAYQAPHSPSRSPPEYLDLYPDIEDQGRKEYLAMVSHFDDGVGRVKAALDQAGMSDNTLVVFVSDNGGRHRDSQYNWPLRGEKRGVYEGGTRTLSFVWGGVLNKQADTYTGLMHASDWFPTLLKLAGGNPDDFDFDGVDNSKFLVNGEESERDEMVYQLDDAENPFQAAIRNKEGWKLIIGKTGSFGDAWTVPPELVATVGNADNLKHETGSAQAVLPNYDYKFNKNWDRRLFHLVKDPNEVHNLYTLYPTIAAGLEERLFEYYEKSVPPRNVPQSSAAHPTNFGGFLTPGWC